MAFGFRAAQLAKQKEEEDQFLPPQDFIHLFDNFVNQFNNACKVLNNTNENCISLRYYLMHEILVFEVLRDCQIPLINNEYSTHDTFLFDNDLSFEAEKGLSFHWSFENSQLFKQLLRSGKLRYYKNRETTLDDLIKKHYYQESCL